MIIKEKAVATISELSQINNFQKVQLNNNNTTVSKGFMAEAIKYTREKNLATEALIRPHNGNYMYNDSEVKIMEADIFETQALGLDSIAIGALTSDHQLDKDVLKQLIAAGGGMQVTLNHVFDQLDSQAQFKAIDFANENEIDYILIHADFDSEEFLSHLKKLVNYNQGSTQLVVTASNEAKLTALCNELGLHQLLVD
ncbi:copper homeostasis protein CutC [Ligilactobacillus sp. LYQ135]